jgi:hypothetical protein
MTKPLAGSKFKQYGALIMHNSSRSTQECVGIPPKSCDTLKVPSTRDTNMRKTTGNKKYNPGKSKTEKNIWDDLRLHVQRVLVPVASYPAWLTGELAEKPWVKSAISQTTPRKQTFFCFGPSNVKNTYCRPNHRVSIWLLYELQPNNHRRITSCHWSRPRLKRLVVGSIQLKILCCDKLRF